MTDGDDNTKDSLAMLKSWHPCTYTPCIISRHHKQTNLPSANSPLDMLMPALNGCICVHGVYLPFSEFLNQLYVTRYWCHREVAPYDTYFDNRSATQDATKLSGFVSASYPDALTHPTSSGISSLVLPLSLLPASIWMEIGTDRYRS